MTRAVPSTRLLAACAAGLVLCMTAATTRAADSPLGDHAGTWPAAWTPYLLSSGSLVNDPIKDVGCGSGFCDVSSAPAGTLSSVFWATDGVNVFFRLRVQGDPRNAAAGGFRSTAFVLQIGVNRQLVAAIGLDAKPAHRDFVYVANADGSAYTEIYAYPFDSSGGEVSGGARAVPDGTGQFFVDWQMPISRITERTNGAVTATTPIQLFFGTSQSANLTVINKDYMTGNAVDFGSSSTIVFVPPPTPATPGAPAAPGAPPVLPAAPGSGQPLLPDTALEPSRAPTPWALPLVLLVLAVSSRMFAVVRVRRG